MILSSLDFVFSVSTNDDRYANALGCEQRTEKVKGSGE